MKPSARRHLLLPAALVLVLLLVLAALRQPETAFWHVWAPGEPPAAAIDAMDWDAWRAREDAMFAALDGQVARHAGATGDTVPNRYRSTSAVYPRNLPHDWNRSFELLPAAPPRGVAVLLHGLSDSPYSMRHLALFYRSRGWAAVAIRLPGHGTTPAALARAGGDEWQAATRLAVREARRLAPGRPLHMVGYSAGGALAVRHALDASAGLAPGAPEALVLLSPLLGLPQPPWLLAVARLAALLPSGFGRAWLDIAPEYNPFRYNSFPLHAAVEAARLAKRADRGLRAAVAAGTIGRFPRVLAFQSVVDSTVSPQAVVHGLFDRLPENGSELVLFDINRASPYLPLLDGEARDALAGLLPAAPRPYRIRVVANVAPGSMDSVVRSRAPGTTAMEVRPLGIPYRRDLASLGHLALPFPVWDGLYGADPDPEDDQGLSLGAALRAEDGILAVPAARLARPGSNPFFPWLLTEIGRAIDAAEADAPAMDALAGAPSAP